MDEYQRVDFLIRYECCSRNSLAERYCSVKNAIIECRNTINSLLLLCAQLTLECNGNRLSRLGFVRQSEVNIIFTLIPQHKFL